MIGRWYAEAGEYDVFPIDGTMMARMPQPRPQIAKDRSTYTFYQNASEMPAGTSPAVYNRPYAIIADLEVPRAAPTACCSHTATSRVGMR